MIHSHYLTVFPIEDFKAPRWVFVAVLDVSEEQALLAKAVMQCASPFSGSSGHRLGTILVILVIGALLWLIVRSITGACTAP
jgi:hypothetical protein